MHVGHHAPLQDLFLHISADRFQCPLFFFIPKNSGGELHMLHSELESVRP